MIDSSEAPTAPAELEALVAHARPRALARGDVIAGWGRLPTVPGVEVRSEEFAELTRELTFARGLGRAYGDAALPAPGDYRVSGSVLADRILAFDPTTGTLTAEAGLSLDEMCRIFLPRGYFTPVSPGTRFVTLGGMVAADIHGKNHHREGTFGRHVHALTVRTGTGRVVWCSPAEHPDLFWATVGGMGLTGAILDVTVGLSKVPTPWIWEERLRVRDIDEFIDTLKSSARMWPMTVGWIDALSSGPRLGRGVLIRGRWAESQEVGTRSRSAFMPGVSVPFDLPGFALGPMTVRAFNTAHYLSHRPRSLGRVVHPLKFFYPLDALRHWTRLYGRRGFTQYQCVLPEAHARETARRVLDMVSRRGATSFLCVIKDCGDEGPGTLSFPMRGLSMALDIPHRDHTQSLVDALNDVVVAAGGRIYLAKDALTRAEHFRAMEPRLERFLAVRRRWDPDGRIRSAQSVRLFGW